MTADPAAMAELLLERLAKEMRDNAALRVQLAHARRRIDQLERSRRTVVEAVP